MCAISTAHGRQWGPPKAGWANNATCGVGDSVLVDGAKRDRFPLLLVSFAIVEMVLCDIDNAAPCTPHQGHLAWRHGGIHRHRLCHDWRHGALSHASLDAAALSSVDHALPRYFTYMRYRWTVLYLLSCIPQESSRNSLETLYAHQLPNGMLPYAGPPVSFYGGSDTYHLWALTGTWNYVQHTGDKVTMI